MLKKIREQLIAALWQDYFKSNDQIKRLSQSLQAKKIRTPVLDHFAVIDLPGPHTGITELSRIFAALGFVTQGKDYLSEKQNDFAWMAACDSSSTLAADALPQVVVADFRLDEMPSEVREIIWRHSSQAQPSPAATIEMLAQHAAHDALAAEKLLTLTTSYLSGREWPLPTVSEFETVRAFNELIAWVLVFGRRPNHFTFSIHLLPEFSDLNSFHQFVEQEAGLPLNTDGGVIKGGITAGIEQGSTAGTPEKIILADGSVELPIGFIEFVWRFQNKPQPQMWDDYFTGFIANHANRVIQSLYTAD